MIAQLSFNQKRYEVNLLDALNISLPIRQGDSNPNCYWADPVEFKTISSGTFIGSVNAGGSVNYQKLTITPHGNGTHTECYGHISADGATINSCLKEFHFIAELVTVTPMQNQVGDFTITKEMLLQKIKYQSVPALVMRTLPNDETKEAKHYSGTNPPYIEPEAIEFLVDHGVNHILVDLPSLDKEVDGGKLAAHKAFWKFPNAIRKHCTVTELIFVDSSINDGLYLLNLQALNLGMDASPSKPVLFKLQEVL